MLAAGALDEVRALLALGLSEELPIMRALGVAALAAHIAGKLGAGGGRGGGPRRETRQYAKRQLTWLETQYDCVEAAQHARYGKNSSDDILSFIDP